ncbi:MAG TPA: hypothetical protein VJY34_09440 [Roseiarcus sp.]|nr:hypothetical protein [Roseiarcus sp.]
MGRCPQGGGPSRQPVVLILGSIGRRYFGEIAGAVNVPVRRDLARIGAIMTRRGLIPA